MKEQRFILSGGGTGGHIYPAIAIADELKRRFPKARFLFVGAEDRMEMEKVPEAGYEIKGLWISGLERKVSMRNLLFPVKLMNSLMKARKIINEFNPDVVIGTGGFASGPLLRSAVRLQIPTVLQEQNSFAGLTNKWLASKALKICVAYDNMENYFPQEKLVFTGNPVRKDLIEINTKREEGQTFFKLDADKKTVLVLGGSLGAKKINETIAEQHQFLLDQDVQLIWQCGKLYYKHYKKYNEQKDIHVHQFLNRMDLAYAAADIVVSRAGALSVSELCLVGKPVVFIPSPNVAEDHQTKNAKALHDKNAAVLLKEEDVDEKFNSVLQSILKSEGQQNQLALNIKKMAKPNATEAIADEIEKFIN